MQLISCVFCENRRREGCTFLIYTQKELITFLYTLKVKNAFVMTVCYVAECVYTLSGVVP